MPSRCGRLFDCSWMPNRLNVVAEVTDYRGLVEGVAAHKPDFVVMDVHMPGLETLGEADSGTAGVKKFQELKPDLVLLDLAMPDIDGIEAARRMHALNPDVPLIMFTLLDTWGLESAARNAGIIRVISKSEGWELMRSIEEVLEEYEIGMSESRPHKVGSAAQKKRGKSAPMQDLRRGGPGGRNSNSR